MDMLPKIHTFWKYISETIADINIVNLRNDIQIIENNKHRQLEEYSLMLGSAGIFYLKMSRYFTDISKDITFIITSNQVEFDYQSDEFDKKIKRSFARQGINLTQKEISECDKIFMRFWIILTSPNGPNYYKLIEDIYQISKQYKLPDDWQVVKFQPPQPSPTFTAPLGDKIIAENMVKYVYFPNKKVIIFAIDLSLENIELYILRRIFKTYLTNLYGEYLLNQKIKRIFIFPKQFHKYISKLRLNYLQSLIHNEEKNIKCNFCILSKYHTDLHIIEDNFESEDSIPVGKYCDYCLARIKSI